MKLLIVLVWLCPFLIGQAAAVESDRNGNIYWGNAQHPIEGAFVARFQSDYPKNIKDLFLNREIDVYSIDLDRDGVKDFIIREIDAFKTCFAKSDFSIISCEELGYGDGSYQFYWFVNIDGDPMLELMSFEGGDDYSANYIYKFDQKTWKMTKRIKIVPVIFSEKRNRSGLYLGGPWDITKLVISQSKGGVRILCSTYNLKSEYDDFDTRGALLVAFKGIPIWEVPVGRDNYLEKTFKFVNFDDLKRRYEIISN